MWFATGGPPLRRLPCRAIPIVALPQITITLFLISTDCQDCRKNAGPSLPSYYGLILSPFARKLFEMLSIIAVSALNGLKYSSIYGESRVLCRCQRLEF